MMRRIIFHVADTINRDVVVSVGEKLNLRCFQSFDAETTWYKDGEVLRRSTTRIRLTKQSLKFKYVELSDAGVYGCRLEAKEGVEWRNVTVYVEPLQNDGFQGEGEGEETSGARTALRGPEEETNDLEIETKSEFGLSEDEIYIKYDIPRVLFRFFRGTRVTTRNFFTYAFADLPETRSLRLENDKVDVEQDNEKTENDTAGEHNNTAPDSPPLFNKNDEMHVSVVKPAGNMLRLRCPSVGNPHPNITWTKNNEEPKRELGTLIRSKWTLRLEDVVPKDSGNYTCIVCNYLGCINHTFKVDIIGE